MNKTRKITECSILIALAFILSYIKVYTAPNGGSITLVSMLPIILISFRHGVKWGVLSAFVYSVLQLMQGFYPPPTETFVMFALVVLLDYIIAFTVIGFANAFNFTKNSSINASIASFIVISLRAVCHIISGTIVWGTAWGGSIVYNLSYLVPEAILTSFVVFFVVKILAKQKV